MAILATRAGVLFAVAVDASRHRGNVVRCDENFHTADLAVAHFAFHAGFQMRAMVPEDPTGNHVDTHPRNAPIMLREFRQFLNGWLFLCDGPVALHALACCRKRHAVAGFGVWVTLQTFQVKRHVQLVAKGYGLIRGWSSCSGRSPIFRG